MINEQRCSVCGRLLGLTTSTSTLPAQYCPDRPCLLYPSTVASRAADPTVSTWAMAVHSSGRVSATAVGHALGRSHAWLARTASEQRRRWERLSV